MTEQAITVEIYGQTYKIRGVRDKETLLRLAEYVNGKMGAVADTVSAADSLKIAILAALNIADEHLQALEDVKKIQELEKIEEKILQLTNLLNKTLENE